MLTPTRELARQVADVISSLTDSLSTVCVYGGAPISPQGLYDIWCNCCCCSISRSHYLHASCARAAGTAFGLCMLVSWYECVCDSEPLKWLVDSCSVMGWREHHGNADKVCGITTGTRTTHTVLPRGWGRPFAVIPREPVPIII